MTTRLLAIEGCPICHAQPRLAHCGLFQARCACGACGPKRKTAEDAVRRWHSVAGYIRKHQPLMGDSIESTA